MKIIGLSEIKRPNTLKKGVDPVKVVLHPNGENVIRGHPPERRPPPAPPHPLVLKGASAIE